MYSKYNSRENYVTLLNSLEQLTTELKEDVWQERRRQRKKQREVQFYHGATNVTHQQVPNVATRSRGAMSVDDPLSLTLRSNSKPGPLSSKEAKRPSFSDQKATVVDPPSITDNPPQDPPINCENSTPKADAKPTTTETGMPTRNKLKQEIEWCQTLYRGRSFIVNSDERSETVNPDEIIRFFSTFQEKEELTNFNLMPLLFSFSWPSTTLVLHSTFTSLPSPKNGNPKSNMRVRWPLSRNHDRVILPCCFERHWTLFDVDLNHNVIREYDSLAGDISKSEKLVSAIKERLAYAMEGWESPVQDFTTVSGVS